MKFWEKWYWANYIRGTNPFKTFIRGLIAGWWIPLLLSAVFCLFTDPQWQHQESFLHFSIIEYLKYYCFFWKTVISVTCHFIYLYASYAWDHAGTIVRWFRHVLWLDDPEAFKYVGKE
jgi:hypothetical protein